MSTDNIQRKQFTATHVTVPIRVFNELMDYIENAEVMYDGEYGHSRDIQTLIKQKCMPKLYNELLTLNLKGE